MEQATAQFINGGLMAISKQNLKVQSHIPCLNQACTLVAKSGFCFCLKRKDDSLYKIPNLNVK